MTPPMATTPATSPDAAPSIPASPTPPRRIFITVAEVSGDQHAAQLVRSLRELDPDLVIEGHGGPAMRSAGTRIIYETTTHAAMNLQAVARAFEMLGLLKRTRSYFQQNPPDLQICVDSPALNFHFAKLAHRLGIPVLYYIAPQLWAWREGRMKKLRRWVDRVACILPFEEEYFRRHGVDATFVGHPLFDHLPHARDGSEAAGHFPNRPPIVGLLPGSRKSEAVHNFPHQLEVATRIREAFPGATFLVPTTPATDPVVARLAKDFPNLERGEGAFDRMVPRCDLCITVSGTATLHVAGHGVPMIVVYRGSPLLWHFIGRWIIRTRTFSLVNLLADTRQHIVPEFVPWHGSNEPVAAVAIDYLQHPEKLDEQREKLKHLIRSLDRPGASMNAAKLALQMMNGRAAQTQR